MANTNPYSNNANHYDRWFDENRSVYEAELRAVKSFIPENPRGLEIGVGTGRFAARLRIRIGIEPVESMRIITQKRNITVLGGLAEYLPFKDSFFDLVMMVTVVCFVSDIYKTFREAFRVLSNDGSIVIGMIDRSSPLGRTYLKQKQKSLFYKQAAFYSVDEMLKIMKQTGFDNFSFRQTIFGDISKISDSETVRTGYGTGLFVVIRGEKQ